LGGVMIWELGSGYRASQPSGQRDPLLQAVKQSLATPRIVGIQSSNQNIQLDFTSLPLALYRVQWTSNFPTVAWNTLTSNVPGTNGTLRITDPGAITTAPERYYRVQTPP
jgi:chitinase